MDPKSECNLLTSQDIDIPNAAEAQVHLSQSLFPDEYFDSYKELDVHRLMLQDEVRTHAYKNMIYAGKEYLTGKVIMDVGAGTGILSLFCARIGAKKVIAVEASGVALLLPEVVKKNGYSDVIEVIHSKVEELTLTEKVDVIVSEWMGFYLLHESMLDSVVYARNKFLKPDTGIILPTEAQIFAAPCSVPELWKDRIGFWGDKPYDFDFGPIANVAKVQTKPEVYSVSAEGLLSEPQLLWHLDLKVIPAESLLKFSDYRFFTVDVEQEEEMHGVCVWFVCKFPKLPGSNIDEDELQLSTAPWELSTHWKQTVILFPNPGKLESGDIIGWRFLLERETVEAGSRSYKIQLEMLSDEDEHPVPCECGSVKCEIVKHFLSKSGVGDQ